MVVIILIVAITITIVIKMIVDYNICPSVARPIPSFADAFTQPKPALVILDLDTT